MRTVWTRGFLYPDLLEDSLHNNTPKLLTWLEDNKSFRFESEHGNISLLKDKKGYWTGHKKVDGHLRKKRIGTSEKLDQDVLEEACYILCNYAGWMDWLGRTKEKKASSVDGLKNEIAFLRRRLEVKDTEIHRLKSKVTILQQQIARYNYSDEDFS